MIVQDYHFKEGFKDCSVYDPTLNMYYNDIENVGTSIRVIGTEEQINNIVKEYIDLHNYTLDEVYDFKVEKHKSFFYSHFTTEKYNKTMQYITQKIKQYKSMYIKNKKKALILRLI